MEISYIIISYNSEKHIGKCINSILNQSHKDYEIIIRDNNSSDGTKQMIQNFCTQNRQIQLITGPNIGYAPAIMHAVKSSKGEFLAILNADAYLDSNWAQEMLSDFRKDEKIMSASGTILFPNGELQSSGGMMDKYGAIVQRGSKIFNARGIRENNFFYNDGSSFMLRRKVLDEVTFAHKLFLYYEDVDLSWQIRMSRHKIGYVKNAISYHDAGQSMSDMTLFKFYYITRNRLYVCLKNYSIKNILTRIPVIVSLLLINSIIYDVSKKEKGYVINFLKAMSWNISNSLYIIKERKKSRGINKISDKELDHYLVQNSIEFLLLTGKPI